MPVRFDAVDDSVDCGTTPHLNGIVPLSISAWVKLSESSAKNAMRLCGKEASGHGWYIYQTNLSAGGTGMTFQLTRPDAGNFFKQWLSAFVVGQWVHIVVTWDGSLAGSGQFAASGLHAYRDGAELTNIYSQQDGAIPRQDDSTFAFVIGNRSSDFLRPFNGEIAQVALYNKVLTENERLQLGRSWRGRMPLQVAPGNLRGYWPIDGNGVALVGAGQVQDLTSYRAHGLPRNSPVGTPGPFAP